jgi:hypothetical protein
MHSDRRHRFPNHPRQRVFGSQRLLHTRLESSQIEEKVDIIVSEWMGYALFFERMLTSVLIGRDKYLKPGGLMLPSHARLLLAAGEASQYRAELIDFWDSVYGFNFQAMKRHSISEAVVEECTESQIMSEIAVISDLDLHICSADVSFFTQAFSLTITQQKSLDGFVTWFEVFFNDMPVKATISTAPSSPETHSKQTWFLLDVPIPVNLSDVVPGSITFQPDPTDEFALLCRIVYAVNDGEQKTQNFTFQ